MINRFQIILDTSRPWLWPIDYYHDHDHRPVETSKLWCFATYVIFFLVQPVSISFDFPTSVDEISNVSSCLFPFCHISPQLMLSRWNKTKHLTKCKNTNSETFWGRKCFPFTSSNNGTFVRHRVNQMWKTFQSSLKHYFSVQVDSKLHFWFWF